MTIPEIIQRMVDKRLTASYGKVTAVDGFLATVEKLDSEAEVQEVRLATANENSFLLVPKIGSVVGMVFVNQAEAFICLYSEVESIRFGDGSNEGLVKVVELTEKLNTLEQDLNSLKQALNTWVPVPQDGGAALKTALDSYPTEVIIETQKEEIQNETITHGNL